MGYVGSYLGSYVGSYLGAGVVLIDPIGADGRLVRLRPEHPTRETLTWMTDVIKSVDGTEHRASLIDTPRRSLELTFKILNDADLNALRAELYRFPSDLRLVPLRHDALTAVTISGTTLTVPAGHIALWDWASPGQRLYVYNDAGQGYEATLQTAAGTTITVDTAPSGGTYRNGATYIAPLVQAYQADGPAVGRYAVNAGTWQARFTSTLFLDALGEGADAIDTYDGHYLLPDDVQPIIESLAQEKTDGGVEVSDNGATLRQYTLRDNSDIARSHEFQADGRAEIQQWRLFFFTVCGRFNTFLLPTFRRDFLLQDAPDGTDTIFLTSTLGTNPDYVTDWFPSSGHVYLRFDYLDGSVVYRKVEAAVDFGGGVAELTLDDTLEEDPAAPDLKPLLSLAEVCRLDSDDVEFAYYAMDRVEFTLQAKAVEQ